MLEIQLRRQNVILLANPRYLPADMRRSIRSSFRVPARHNSLDCKISFWICVHLSTACLKKRCWHYYGRPEWSSPSKELFGSFLLLKEPQKIATYVIARFKRVFALWIRLPNIQKCVDTGLTVIFGNTSFDYQCSSIWVSKTRGRCLQLLVMWAGSFIG